MILFLFAARVALSTGQSILQGPESVTVFANQIAHFSCVTNGQAYWMLNGTELSQDDVMFHDASTEGIHLFTLSILARLRYNLTRVQCVVPGSDTQTVSLKVQGLLDPVNHLYFDSNDSSLTISWTPPFSLDVTGVDPDIWYSVFIYDLTDENNPTAILCTDCINITETHYTFAPDHLSPCHVYNFSVIPLNGAGRGNASNYTSSMNVTASGPFQEKIVVFKQSTDVYRVLITAPLLTSNYNTVFCFPLHLNLYYKSSDEHCPTVVSAIFPKLTQDNVWFIESEVALGKDCDYTVHFTLPNGTGDTNFSGTFAISTRVLTVAVEELEGEVVVRCVFRHTLSEECYVQLVSSEVEGGFQEGGCVEGEGEGVRRFSDLLPATYTVLVYGLAAGGEEDSCSPASGDPDYISVATVYGPHPSSLTSHPSTTGGSLNANSSPLCTEGIGVGICMGSVVTCLLFVIGIITVKVLLKHKEKASSQHVAMEKNMAYELHKPRLQRKELTGPN